MPPNVNLQDSFYEDYGYHEKPVSSRHSDRRTQSESTPFPNRNYGSAYKSGGSQDESHHQSDQWGNQPTHGRNDNDNRAHKIPDRMTYSEYDDGEDDIPLEFQEVHNQFVDAQTFYSQTCGSYNDSPSDSIGRGNGQVLGCQLPYIPSLWERQRRRLFEPSIPLPSPHSKLAEGYTPTSLRSGSHVDHQGNMEYVTYDHHTAQKAPTLLPPTRKRERRRSAGFEPCQIPGSGVTHYRLE